MLRTKFLVFFLSIWFIYKMLSNLCSFKICILSMYMFWLQKVWNGIVYKQFYVWILQDICRVDPSGFTWILRVIENYDLQSFEGVFWFNFLMSFKPKYWIIHSCCMFVVFIYCQRKRWVIFANFGCFFLAPPYLDY